MINTSESEKLVYIDFDVVYDLDVVVYPDSNKIVICAKDSNRIYKLEDEVGY